MRYLEGRDVIIAVNVKGPMIAEYHQFDFSTNQWVTVKLDTAIMENKVPLNWRVCYDRDDDVLYFVSDELHILRYGMESGEYEMIMDRNEFGMTFIRAIWVGHSTSTVLCCLLKNANN